MPKSNPAPAAHHGLRRVACALAIVSLLAAVTVPCAFAAERDLFSDTWVGHDALDRTIPTFSQVGSVKTDHRRVVGIFYITWHRDSLQGLKSPYQADVSQLLQKDPGARLDAKHPLWTEGSYHWGEPELGYFLSRDEFVIRKDMSMLADAGVDVLVLDVTNGVHYWEEWETLFAVMENMQKEGNKVPHFCFWAFNGPAITVVQELYEKIYKPSKHKDLWFYWDDKPLLLYNGNPSVDANGKGVRNPNPHFDSVARTNSSSAHFGNPEFTTEFYEDYTKEVKGFFTLRTMWWGYWEWAGKRFVGTEDNWSFGLDLGDKRVATLKPEQLVSRHDARKEEAAVTPAQHPSSLVGKSWTREDGEPALNKYELPEPTIVPWLRQKVEHPEGYGIYFQQRWDEAIQGDPDFLYLNDWNEWTAGKYSPAGSGTTRFMRRDSPYFFVDQYNPEFNRSIQPMKGGYTDNYYMQMAENIRRYKGVRPIPELTGFQRIKMDGEFSDWNAVQVEYRDTIGDTFHRDYDGYGGLHYTDMSGRNDIVRGKVAIDRHNVYFYVETKDPLTSCSGTNWMLLLIDVDQNPNTGWFGYDYLINHSIPNEKTTTLKRYIPAAKGGGEWKEVARLSFRYHANALELAVPRKLLGLSGQKLSFDFHWSDNPVELKDPISLCTSGDSAPNRRFNYRCIWRRKSS